MRQEWQAILPVVARLPRYGRLVFGLTRDPRLKPSQKAALAGAVLYNLSPLDLVPGVVPVLGQLDDLLVLLLAVRSVLADCPDLIVREHLQRSGLSAWQVRQDPDTVKRLLWRLAKELGRITGRCLAHGIRLSGSTWVPKKSTRRRA